MGRSEEQLLESLIREMVLQEIAYTPDPGGSFGYTGGGAFTKLGKTSLLGLAKGLGSLSLGIGKFVSQSGLSILNAGAMIGITAGLASTSGWKSVVGNLYDDMSQSISGIIGISKKDLLSLFPPEEIIEPALFQETSRLIAEGVSNCDDLIDALEMDVENFERECQSSRSRTGPSRIDSLFEIYSGHIGKTDASAYDKITQGVDPVRLDRMINYYMRKMNKLTASLLKEIISKSDLRSCLPSAMPLIQRIESA